MWHINAAFGNAWGTPEHMFAVRSPSSRKPWEKNPRQGAKTVKKFERLENDGPELSPADATMFRALAARANYLAQDRPDLAFPAKEMRREFAVPTRKSRERLEKYAGTHVVCQDLCTHTLFQSTPPNMTMYVDTGFAGCRSNRRSTSGGVIMFGSHRIKHWSSTQKQFHSPAQKPNRTALRRVQHRRWVCVPTAGI